MKEEGRTRKDNIYFQTITIGNFSQQLPRKANAQIQPSISEAQQIAVDEREEPE